MRLRSILVLAAAVAVCMSGPAFGDPLELRPDLRRVDPTKDLPGYSFDTTLNGSTQYVFRKDKVLFRAAQAAEGEGTWSVSGKHGVKGSGTYTGGPCSDERGDCGETREFSFEFKDLWKTDNVFVFTDPTYTTGPYVMTCEDKDCYPTSALIKLIAGAKDTTLFDEVVANWETSSIVVGGEPAENPREVTEIWWVNPQAERIATHVASTLKPHVGPAEVKQWTWGGAPYDVIVIVGEKKSE